MLMQVLAAGIQADDEPAWIHASESPDKSPVACPQVQDKAVVARQSLLEAIPIQIMGHAAPNCFHVKPPVCRIDRERQSGAGWSSSVGFKRKQTAASGT